MRFRRSRPDRAQRESASAWTRFRRIVETLVFAIGVPTAIVAFLALGPQAWEATHERQVSYGDLRWLHAGYSTEFLQSRFGVPTLARSVSATPKLTQLVYVEREFAVSAVVDEADSAVVVGVFACNPDFEPTLLTPAGTQVVLNRLPLATAETDPRPDGISTADLADRVLRYPPDSRAGREVVELGTQSGTVGTALAESYLLGVNGACGADVGAPVSEQVVSGGTASAAFDRYRARTAPNFYAESVDPGLRVDDDGCLRFSTLPDDAACVHPTPARSELPVNFVAVLRPEWWQNLP
jgi:hypothetical protein